MEREVVSLAAGGVVLIVGLFMMRAHWRAWARQKMDPALDQAEREHLHRRYRRRMQTSGLLAALGPLIAAGLDLVPAVIVRAIADPRQQIILISVYWIVVLLLTLWVILLGIGDYLATSTHARAQLAQLQHAQRELQQQLDSLRRNANGHHDEKRE